MTQGDLAVLEYSNKVDTSVNLDSKLRAITQSRNDYIRIPEIQNIIKEMTNMAEVQGKEGLADLLNKALLELTNIDSKVHGQYDPGTILDKPDIFSNAELTNISFLLNDLYDRMAGVHKVDNEKVSNMLRDLRTLIIKILSVALTRPLVYVNDNIIPIDYVEQAKNAIRHAKTLDIRDETSNSATVKLGDAIDDFWIENKLTQAA